MATLLANLLSAGPGPGRLANATEGQSVEAVDDPASRILADRLIQIAAAIDRAGSIDAGSEDRDNAMDASRALIEMALRLNPDDPDLLRRGAEVAERVGDRARGDELRRHLLQIDPADEWCQLRVIAGRLEGLDEAEKRLVVLDRFLGQTGQAIDNSVRSRLALEAADLLNEQGKALQAVGRLHQAVQLDASNVEAAEAVVEYYNSPETIDELVNSMLSAVIAAPVDPSATYRFSRTVLTLGAYDAARTALENTEIVFRLSKQIVPIDVVSTKALVLAVTDGPENAAEYLSAYRNELSDREEARLLREWEEFDEARSSLPADEAESLAPPPVQLENVADIQVDLPRSLQVLHLAFLEWDHDAKRAKAQLQQLASTWRRDEAELRSLIADADSDSEKAASLKLELAALLHERLSTRLCLRPDSEKDQPSFNRTVQADLNELATLVGSQNLIIRRLQPWIDFRSGLVEQAIKSWRADTSIDAQSRVGLGLACESAGQEELALREYLNAADQSPGSLAGVAAEISIERLRGHRRTEPDALRPMTERANQTLERTRNTILAEHASIDAKIIHAPENVGLAPLSPLDFEVEISNRSTLPLAIGPGGSYEVTVGVRSSIHSLDASKAQVEPVRLPIEFFPVDRTISLAPGESTVVPIRLRRSTAGFEIDQSGCSTLCRVDFGAELRVLDRVVQDRIEIAGSDQGYLSVAIKPGRQVGTPQPPLDGTVSPSNFERVLFLGQHLRRHRDPDEMTIEVDRVSDDWVDEGIGTLMSKWPVSEERLHAWILLTIPAADRANQPERLAQFESVARDSLDPLSLAAWVLTRVETIADPVLQRALASDDASVRAIGRYVASRLRPDGQGEHSQSN